jgi:hypothetical protein
MKIKIYIVTYKKNDILNRNIRSLYAATRDMNGIDVTVLANHPDVALESENRHKNLRVVINATRMPHAWGHLSQDWNYALLDAFKRHDNPDSVDWAILAQNDVEWVDGWDEWVRNNKEYDFVSQPRGDQCLLFNIEAVRTIGFFDENFATILYQEIDYFVRAVMENPSRISINDDHHVHNFTINPVGNVITKSAASYDPNSNDQTLHNTANYPQSYGYICGKYNVDIFTLNASGALRLAKKNKYRKELNLFPFFWHNGGEKYADRLFKKYDIPELRRKTRFNLLSRLIQRWMSQRH